MFRNISSLNNDLAFLEIQGLIKGKLFLKIEALNLSRGTQPCDDGCTSRGRGLSGSGLANR